MNPVNIIAVIFLLACTVTSLVIPKQEFKSKRVFDNELSDETHYNQNEEHNPDYDHEAFLGEASAKTFNELSSEESKLRLGKIVDKIDADKDGFVSLQELKDWIQFSQKQYIVDDAERQWKGLNVEDRPDLSWKQYKKLTYGFVEGEGDISQFQYKDMLDRDSRRWQKADRNSDGSLNKEEFVDFVHPEEAEHMKDIVVLETMEDIDKDKDGKISMDEYIGDMYGDGDVDEEPNWVQNEKEQFTNFRDENKDGFMDMYEVKKWILPDNYDNSDSEARHLVYESDVNRDNVLSKEEILDKFDLFVGSQATDFGEALTRHDEF